MAGNKFHARKVKTNNGTYDSSLEYKRSLVLKDWQRKGMIENLREQVAFELIPAQYLEYVKHLKTKDKIEKVLVERSVVYKADFVYDKIEHKEDGAIVKRKIVEDTKSPITRTPEYRIKKKLMRYLLGEIITEISHPTQEV